MNDEMRGTDPPYGSFADLNRPVRWDRLVQFAARLVTLTVALTVLFLLGLACYLAFRTATG